MEDSLFFDKAAVPPLVLLHGFPTCGWDWHRVIPELSQHFDCIVPDLMGFGFSDTPSNNDYATAQQIRSLEQSLQQLKITQCHIMAFSYGSSVAQEWLKQYQEHSAAKIEIKSVSFLNGGLFPETNHPRPIQKLLLSPMGSIITKFVGKKALGNNLKALFSDSNPLSQRLLDEYWQYITFNKANQRLHKQIGYLRERTLYAQQWQNALMHAQLPIQLQFGCEDHLSGPKVVEQFQKIRAAQPGNRQDYNDIDIHLYRDVGHYPQLEIPGTVASTYLRFINSER